MKKVILFVFTSLLWGCATAYKMNHLSIGMCKEEVVEKLGTPTSTRAQGITEYLDYKFSETSDDAYNGRTTSYFVRLIDGQVESYGKWGDFDSTKTPTSNIDLNIRNK